MCARSGTHRHGMRSHSSGGRTRKESLNFSSPWRCQSHRNAAQCLGLAVPPPPCPDASHRPHLPPHHAPAEHQLIHCDSPELFRALSDHSWESCGEGAPRWGSVGVHGCGSGAERPGGAYKTGALGGAGSGESLPAAAAMVTGSGGRWLLLVLLAAVALLGAPGRGQPRGEGADLRDGGASEFVRTASRGWERFLGCSQRAPVLPLGHPLIRSSSFALSSLSRCPFFSRGCGGAALSLCGDRE